MDAQRAQEIAASPTMINVTYQGTPIYIQRVDPQNQTAKIYPLGQPDQEQNVPLGSLSEQ